MNTGRKLTNISSVTPLSEPKRLSVCWFGPALWGLGRIDQRVCADCAEYEKNGSRQGMYATLLRKGLNAHKWSTLWLYWTRILRKDL